MLDFRHHAKDILDRSKNGERMLLMYRGRPAMVLEPYQEVQTPDQDGLYSLADFAEEGTMLTNDQIDEVIYG
jgi:hypothetical protein